MYSCKKYCICTKFGQIRPILLELRRVIWGVVRTPGGSKGEQGFSDYWMINAFVLATYVRSLSKFRPVVLQLWWSHLRLITGHWQHTWKHTTKGFIHLHTCIRSWQADSSKHPGRASHAINTKWLDTIRYTWTCDLPGIKDLEYQLATRKFSAAQKTRQQDSEMMLASTQNYCLLRYFAGVILRSVTYCVFPQCPLSFIHLISSTCIDILLTGSISQHYNRRCSTNTKAKNRSTNTTAEATTRQQKQKYQHDHRSRST